MLSSMTKNIAKTLTMPRVENLNALVGSYVKVAANGYDHDLEGIENDFAKIANSCDLNVHLIAVRINNWNDELSPWEAPAVFEKKEV